MYIKQIIIQGFKSYKDQTVIEPFSPKHNVIVGRNGSGKSNFFAAVRFVLSDQYTQMGREERAALLHEGAGSAVMSAYVEIIFDNSDERFPTGTEDVILRRTIGQKKDEYSLNRKNTTKAEVMNLLESAGFSKSNPYYIVPQGRVTRITNMKDTERLDMLKEVAGTQVYEARRAESNRIMEETNNKRMKIDEVLDSIRTRLGELEEEKEELRAFQDKDRERRCLEYAIHRKDKEALDQALALLDEDREGGVSQTDEDREALIANEARLEDVETEISQLQQQLKILNEEHLQLEDERRTAAREQAKIELDVQAIGDDQAAAQMAESQQAAALQETESQIQLCEAELGQILPEYEQKVEAERVVRQQLHATETAQKRLYAKQGRQQQYKSKRDRDQYLRREIDEMNVLLSKRKATAMGVAEQIPELEEQIKHLEADITDMRKRIDNRGDEQQTISADVQRVKDERDQLMDQRKELWREEAKLTSVIKNAQHELEKAEQFLSRMMDQNTRRGLDSVRRIVKQHNIEGAHGTLGELFEYNDKYKTAIEVTAGNSLFDFVVDTDDVAAKIVQILQKEKGGRVTFMPLNRLRPRPANLPDANDAVKLISKLQYEPRFENAVQQVFGKTIVCPNLQVAAQYARSHGVNAITPEGDRSDKKGALTGGYHDVRSSRIDGLKRRLQAREAYESTAERKEEISREVERINQQITKSLSNLQKLEQRRSLMDGGYGPLRDELRRREQEVHSRVDELAFKRKTRESIELSVREMSDQLGGYQTELASDFKQTLSSAEERELEQISAQLPALKKQAAELSSQRSDLENRKSTLEVQLREKLKPMRDDLLLSAAEMGASDGGSGPTRLIERQRDLKRITSALKSITEKLLNNEAQVEKIRTQIQSSETARAELQGQIESLKRALHSHQKGVEKAAAKRTMLASRLTDVSTQIRNLGALPDAAFTAQYTNLSFDTATKRLHKVQEALKKYGRVNKKAFEQFAQFERQREVLETRREELDNSDNSIRELIDVLDQRKDEAIERTFRQVSREFASVFERLVPAGKGRLIIQRRSDAAAAREAAAAEASDSEDEAATHSAKANKGVENYTGVGISVSFNSKHDEQQRIQQLSGGQKSLCALALVFAIQASDPAPFYLFDEIDANLDAQYRTAVAALLQSSSQTGQFICTTFRPEMVHVAEKCYGVSYLHKASSIDVVSTEQALEFVEGQVSGGK